MALPWKRICLPVCGLIRHVAALQIPSTRKKHSVPWYQEVLQKPDKMKVQKEDQRSILRNPGIVTVGKLSKEELCQHLAQNVVYREGPLLAINKPQGLSIAGTSEEISLVSILPDLQQLLEIKPELHVVKAAPKESSGLVLLSTCHVTTKHFEDFYSQCRKAKKPFTTFRAITLGVPDPAEGDVKVALKEEDIKDLRLVVPVTDPSRGSLERREVKETRTLYKVLDSADGCSLLQLQPMTEGRREYSSQDAFFKPADASDAPSPPPSSAPNAKRSSREVPCTSPGSTPALLPADNGTLGTEGAKLTCLHQALFYMCMDFCIN
ncbi:mitochondrial mRNA pseudouridine synthase RPUSD3 isoform X2 [Aquarana catesbeiana]|uniref:mitochondrial mRNA pseudouridine synthase RPUSD3 isoform X2 n=1 Tax=Aquarana catesbeiana TaxID=8400 RepID=UPI003CCA5517